MAVVNVVSTIVGFAATDEAEDYLAGRISEDDFLDAYAPAVAFGFVQSAAFFATGTLGIEALRRCAALGIAVPGQLAMAAYDDEPEAASATPPLTAVRQPVARIAQEAVALLLRLIDGNETPPDARQRVVPVEIVYRDSSAGPLAKRPRAQPA